VSNSLAHIAVIPGDGIGGDVTASALAVADAACGLCGIKLHYETLDAGAGYYRENGSDVAPGSEAAAEAADAIFLGAIGLPDIRNTDGTEISPHLRWRENLGLYAGVRPVRAYPNTVRRLSDERAAGIDMVIVRESTEGLFWTAAAHNRNPVANNDEVQEVMRITRATTEKLHDFAFRLAARRQKRGGAGLLTCVDKANVFRSMAFFRSIFDERRMLFPDVTAGYNYVDAQALDLIRRPWDFDVLVMENIFGDILSDLAGGLVGGMGMAPCGEIGDTHGMFQPAHGSAPDIAGKDLANPLAAVLSAAMMLDYLAEKSGDARAEDAALLIERSVHRGFAENVLRPAELGGDMGTKAVTEALLDDLRSNK